MTLRIVNAKTLTRTPRETSQNPNGHTLEQLRQAWFGIITARQAIAATMLGDSDDSIEVLAALAVLSTAACRVEDAVTALSGDPDMFAVEGGTPSLSAAAE